MKSAYTSPRVFEYGTLSGLVQFRIRGVGLDLFFGRRYPFIWF